MLVKFAQALHTAYKRVNKAGSFNTRCFPAHSCTGHSEFSFCGRPLVIVTAGFPDGVQFFVEFAIKDSHAKTSAAQFSCEGFLGVQLAHGVVVFNRDLHVWKYSWKSARHTFDTLHVVRVYAFSKDTGQVWLAQDSSPFTVSSTKSCGEIKPQPDLIVVLSAMSRLVPSSRALPPSIDFEFDFTDEDMVNVNEEDGFPALSEAEEARFLAHEKLRAVLERLYAYMTKHYSQWRSSADMYTAVQIYLLLNESASVEKLAASVVLAGLAPSPEPPVVLSMSFSPATALNIAQSALDADEMLVDAIEPHGRNDVTGLYMRGAKFNGIMTQLSANAAWSPVDQDLHARVEKTFIAVLSPKHLFVSTVGIHTYSDLLAVGAANMPNDKRPTMFGASSTSRLDYVFPTNRGVIKVAVDADFGIANTLVAKLTPVAEGVQFHIMLKAQNPETGRYDVVKDVCTVFHRVSLTAADM